MPRFASNGWIRGHLVLPSIGVQFDGTGALTIVNSLDPGRQMVLESLGFCASSTAGASSGSQVFKLRKGGTTGTVLATLTIPVASVDALGDVIEAAVSATLENATLDDDDTISITRDASGTTFGTDPVGFWFIRYRERPQLDA